MSEQGYEQLTLFPGDFPVNRSPRLENEKGRTMTVISGLRCLESYANSGPLGCLVKMCLGSSIWHSRRCTLTWKKKVTKSKLSLFQLAVSMLPTKDSEPQFWPTPSTGAALCAGTGNFKTLRKMAEKGLITEEERREFSKGNGGKTNPQLLEWLMGYEQQFTDSLLPTPTATDYKGGKPTRYWTPTERERERERADQYHHLLREFLECTPLGRIGPMNPNWIEWLMGYPIGWTELSASETPLSHSNSTRSSKS